jgi:hypothetical protein
MFMKYKLLMDIELNEIRTRFKHGEMHASHEKSITNTKVEHLEAELQQARQTIWKKEIEFQEVTLLYIRNPIQSCSPS